VVHFFVDDDTTGVELFYMARAATTTDAFNAVAGCSA
jgi:hypothetical protein